MKHNRTTEDLKKIRNPYLASYTYVTTEAERDEIVRLYRTGETLTAATRRVCTKIPVNAEGIQFLDDIFEPACRIRYLVDEDE